MKIERSKNAKRNIIWGGINQITNVLLPFVCRTLFIYVLGKEYLGLNNLFSSILSVLSLAELGVGSAMVYCMYKPIAKDDVDTICALMNLYKKLYRGIGCVILLLGLLLLPFVPKLVSGSYPYQLNLYVIYCIELAGTAITYFLFSYKNCLIAAFQRNDIVSRVALIIQILTVLLRIIVLLFIPNYYLYLAIVPVLNICNNIIIAVIVGKMYPEFKARGSVDRIQFRTIVNKVKSLFLYRIGYTVTNSVDSIVISAFLGVAILGTYSNYIYIITSVYAFITVIYNAIKAGIGNCIATETPNQNYERYKKILFMQHWLIIWCCVCFCSLYQDFIRLWIGENMLLSTNMVFLFVLYFFVLRVQDVVNIYKEAAGMWDQDKWRPLLTALCNLIINIILVQFIGLYGVLLSTIIAILIVSIPWCSTVLYKNYFHVSVIEFFKVMIKSLVLMIGLSGLTYTVCNFITNTNWFGFVIKMVICLLLPNLVFVIIHRNSKDMINGIAMVSDMIGFQLWRRG